MSALSLLRVPFFGTRAGAGTALVTLVAVGLGLALGAGRLRGAAAPGLSALLIPGQGDRPELETSTYNRSDLP